jgi:GNAT superfamily N-acetyltransferase
VTAPDFSGVRVRRATRDDAPIFLHLVDALADYEHLDPPDDDAKARLVGDGFGPSPRFEALLVEVDGAAAGYAITFETYSSFLALPTLYLEDLFVLPAYRHRKAGLALFLAVADAARARGCGRMEWTVLDWNIPAQRFYDNLGAEHLKDWFLHRLTAERLAALPAGPPVG